MALSDITDRGAVLSAIEEFDRLGEETFLATYRFDRARKYVLEAAGQVYPSKAIVGVAHGYQFPAAGALRPEDFSGGDATVVRVLRRLGFDVVAADDPVLWTDAELHAAVSAYRAMWEAERSGKHVVKSRVIRELCEGPLRQRSPGSVSRRMNNISAVLDEIGLPRVQGYAPLEHVGAYVRPRLERLIRAAWDADVTPDVVAALMAPVRVVPVGTLKQETYDVPGMPARVARRVEQALVSRYEALVVARGRVLVAHEYAGGQRCDAFDADLNVLIEAKANPRRESARMALGQLLDYRRHEPTDPTLAVLLPGRPPSATIDFLVENNVVVIWEVSEGVFADTSSGRFS